MVARRLELRDRVRRDEVGVGFDSTSGVPVATEWPAASNSASPGGVAVASARAPYSGCGGRSIG
jgi:hypothetical protein